MPNIKRKDWYDKLAEAKDAGYRSGCSDREKLRKTINQLESRRQLIREDALHALAQMVSAVAEVIVNLGKEKP